MMFRHIQILAVVIIFTSLSAAPVDKSKKKEESEKHAETEELDDFGLEYGRYLQQVVQVLEEDKEFARKLENVSSEQLKNGLIAHELKFVDHSVRSKLDELKRIELSRLRKLVQEKLERSEQGASEDGRQWRTIPGHKRNSLSGDGSAGDFWLGLNRHGISMPQHLDFENAHSFEIDDLKKLIQSATKDLEELDRQRREEFKKYEMEKELQYRESLKNLTEDEKKETVKHHEELIQKHKDHPKVHHPGSKPQLEQVWEEEDHLPKDEFNPRTFFAMHDINGDGHLDEKEVEALLMPEVKKMYDPKNEEDDPTEMEEEYHRMREHIFNETDKNRDSMISLEEFLKMTQEQDFEQDEGWKGLDEQTIYSEADFEDYMRQRQLEMQNPHYGDPRAYYDVPNAQNQGLPPHINYHPGVPPPQQPGGYPPQYQQQYQGVPQHQQQFQGAAPQHQQQFQGIPPQHQQQFQGAPQHQQQFQGVPPPQHQQQFQGVPQQQQHQQFQGVPPQQQQFQGVPPQQQQQFQGVPPQHQQFQGVPQQQFQGVPQQPQGGIQQPQVSTGQLQQPQANAIPSKPNVNKIDTNEIPQGGLAKDKVPNPSIEQHPPKV